MTKPSGAFYRHILADAWKAVRKNKALWLLGFFVSFLGNGGVYELLIQGTGRLGLDEDFGGLFSLGLMSGGGNLGQALASAGTQSLVVFLLVALTALGLAAVAVWVVVSAQGGLIAGARDAERGRKTTFGSLFAAGNEVAWPLFVLNALSRLAVMAFFYLLLSLTILYLADANLWSSFSYLAGFVLLIPLTLIIGFVTIYAACYVTLQRLPLVAAIESAIALFRKYWLISLETALALFGVNLLAAFGIAAATTLASVVLLPLLVGASLLEGGALVGGIIAVASLAAVVLLAVVGGGLAAFQYAVWVHLFTKLHQRGHGGKSKIARWFEKLLK
ncbi:MAG TPA: hypothetical protein VJ694_04235 [Patescibacteria group bacterium]|nr:hypothetical protein [Patescibacteria group bacterium]